MKLSLTSSGSQVLAGIFATSAGLVLLNFYARVLLGSITVIAGALCLLLANPSSIPLLGKAVRYKRTHRASPLPQNDIAQIAYDVRHAPRPGRLL